MRTLIALLILSFVYFAQTAQFPSRNPEVTKLAREITKAAGKLKNAPFHTELDFSGGTIYAQKSVGALLIPSKEASRERIDDVGTKTLPLGEVWFHESRPSTRRFQRFTDSQLHIANVIVGEKNEKFRGLILGIRRNGSGPRELLVYGTAKRPLLQLPIKSVPLHQRHPIDLSASSNNGTGLLHLHLFGGYTASIPIIVTKRT